MVASVNGRSYRTPTAGKIGVTFPLFNSGSNKAPLMPIAGTATYQSIKGLMTIQGYLYIYIPPSPSPYTLTPAIPIDNPLSLPTIR